MVNLGITGVVIWLTLVVTMFAAWTTHVINTIQDNEWILLIIGIIVPPIGWLHGIAIWFGWVS